MSENNLRKWSWKLKNCNHSCNPLESKLSNSQKSLSNKFAGRLEDRWKNLDYDLSKNKVPYFKKSLGLIDSINYKHPFPGPGLSIRIVGKINKERVKILQEADYIYINELTKNKLYNKIWQAYAALLPIKTVGVMGDSRTYENICLLRAVTSEDGMTADYFSFPKKFIDRISNKIINNVKGINRVVYDITSKPPSTIELE